MLKGKKLIVLFLLTAVFTLSVIACSKGVDLSVYLSQDRVNLFKGETEEYKITLYSERRETPQNNDGFVGELDNYAVINLEFLGEKQSDLKVSFSYKKNNYEKDLTYNPVSANESAVIKTEELIDGEDIVITVISDGGSEEVNLISLKNSDILSTKEILNIVKDNSPDLIDKYFKKGKNLAEINVRLLEDEGKNYYYVGVINADKKIIAFLIDAKSGKVLAEKTI